jgi:hypothetical protein
MDDEQQAHQRQAECTSEPKPLISQMDVEQTGSTAGWSQAEGRGLAGWYAYKLPCQNQYMKKLSEIGVVDGR